MVILTNALAKAMADTAADATDFGTTDLTGDMVFYDATGGVPADADVAISTQVLLAQVELEDPAFGAAADATPGGEVTLLGVPLSDISVDADGTVAFVRIRNRNNLAIMQLTIGTGSEDVIVDNTTLVAGTTLTVKAVSTLKMPES